MTTLIIIGLYGRVFVECDVKQQQQLQPKPKPITIPIYRRSKHPAPSTATKYDTLVDQMSKEEKPPRSKKSPFQHSRLGYNTTTTTTEETMKGGMRFHAFFFPVWIGEGAHKQMFMVDLDTGSTTLAIPSADCKLFYEVGVPTNCSCSQSSITNPYEYGPSAVSVQCSNNKECPKNEYIPDTLHCTADKKCQFVTGYADGSFLLGAFVKDTVSFAGLSVTAKFGAITQQSLRFNQQDCPVTNVSMVNKMDGILGLAYKSLEPAGGDDIFSLMVQKHGIDNSFSICCSQNGGVFVMGGADPVMNTTKMTYTKIIQELYYSIRVLDLLVDNSSVISPQSQDILSKNPSVVDTGSTLLILDVSVYLDLIRYLKSKKEYKDLAGFSEGSYLWGGYCYDYSDDESYIDNYPTISLTMPGEGSNDPDFRIEIGPRSYLVQDNGLWCWGIVYGGFGSGQAMILGDVALQGHNVHFDRGNKRIGFAEASDRCNKKSEDKQYYIDPMTVVGALPTLNDNNDKKNKNEIVSIPLIGKVKVIDDSFSKQSINNNQSYLVVPTNLTIVITVNQCHFLESGRPTITKSPDIYGYFSVIVQCDNSNQYNHFLKESELGAAIYDENGQIISNKAYSHPRVTDSGRSNSSNHDTDRDNHKSSSTVYSTLFFLMVGLFIVFCAAIVGRYMYQDYFTKSAKYIRPSNGEDQLVISPLQNQQQHQQQQQQQNNAILHSNPVNHNHTIHQSLLPQPKQENDDDDGDDSV
ncbi:hypothetical protein DFA_05035 [Cavenderia fasciculata]|uniref:Peptidase A1 domain-containing protein n=1 Tax=Cavenderia fasciculata TaxID=261658 RepID=F4PN12_CACFS|nr:uncharacterized protein DFA_05035 [Cavenderia fasciculata]EGG22905.1 hypothetical protein DFA_05035 [Cavenderia fasciculata]|eukprot:XP_004360756.1 hypothetical protein DFA_05035 [Cavenderia fasciculata]